MRLNFIYMLYFHLDIFLNVFFLILFVAFTAAGSIGVVVVVFEILRKTLNYNFLT